MGNNYNPNPGVGGDPGFSGYVKSSDGKITQVVPWVYINSVPGAGLAVVSTESERAFRRYYGIPESVVQGPKIRYHLFYNNRDYRKNQGLGSKWRNNKGST